MGQGQHPRYQRVCRGGKLGEVLAKIFIDLEHRQRLFIHLSGVYSAAARPRGAALSRWAEPGIGRSLHQANPTHSDVGGDLHKELFKSERGLHQT